MKYLNHSAFHDISFTKQFSDRESILVLSSSSRSIRICSIRLTIINLGNLPNVLEYLNHVKRVNNVKVTVFFRISGYLDGEIRKSRWWENRFKIDGWAISWWKRIHSLDSR